VALGNLRVAQAIHCRGDLHGRPPSYRRCLARAAKTLQRALAIDRLEAEARNRGELASAQVNLLLGNLETARVQALHALKQARQYELTWLVARAYHLSGNILAAQGQQQEAHQYFEQALQIFRKGTMRLETARTLQSYALALLRQNDGEESSHQQALSYLKEAQQICSECHVVLDQLRSQ